jgi:regulator of protease activity HflC (stomatin/prohibitin superfamily)
VRSSTISWRSFAIVLSYQKGVRWTFGIDPVALEPGFHWKLWLMHRVEVINVVDEVIELPVQSVITADEKLVCFSVNIGFRFSDIGTGAACRTSARAPWRSH